MRGEEGKAPKNTPRGIFLRMPKKNRMDLNVPKEIMLLWVLLLAGLVFIRAPHRPPSPSPGPAPLTKHGCLEGADVPRRHPWVPAGGRELVRTAQEGTSQRAATTLQDPPPSFMTPYPGAARIRALQGSGVGGICAGGGKGSAAEVSPTSPFPPAAARVQIQPSAEVREGEAVTLSCEVPGDVGPATFTWYRNGRWLREGVEPALSFPAIRSADAGAFQCLAQGSGHSHSSAAVTLRVLCECRGGTIFGGGEVQKSP